VENPLEVRLESRVPRSNTDFLVQVEPSDGKRQSCWMNVTIGFVHLWMSMHSRFAASRSSLMVVCLGRCLTMGLLGDSFRVRLFSPDFWNLFTSYHLPSTENRRPDIPNNHPWTEDLARIIESCWQRVAHSRPKFSNIVVDLEVVGGKHDVPLQHTSPSPDKMPCAPTKTSPDGHQILHLREC